MTNYTPETLAERVTAICNPIGPARGYTMEEYNGARRLEAVAEMAAALHEGIGPADAGTVAEALKILEWDNAHTAGLALALAYGDAAEVLGALHTVHMAGQSYAIYRGLDRPELAR